MIASILITGGNSDERLEKAFELTEKFLGRKTTNNPDFLFIEEKDSIKIEQIREIKKELSLKPAFSLAKVVLLSEAEKITLPAQHSLLKILEEPPGNAVIILVTQNKRMLLPTIISRCQTIRLKQPLLEKEESDLEEQTKFLKKILVSSPGQRLMLAENFQGREEAINFCQKQLVFLREILRAQIFLNEEESFLKKGQILRLLKSFQKGLNFLKANVNPKLLVENLLLSYPF
jgi:DNA polymerase III delta prime subunit